MSGAKLHLAGLDDLERLVPMVLAFHQDDGIKSDEDHVRKAITPILEGLPYGEIYLAGPRQAPLGYAFIVHSWSIEFGALDIYVDEIFLRPPVRGRGLGTQVLGALTALCREKGANSMALVVGHDNAPARALYRRGGFVRYEGYDMLWKSLT